MRKVIKLCLLLVLIIKAEHTLYAQNTLDKVGLSGSSPALVAYSMRKLSSSYTGPAIQIRRSTDGAVQDIGFTAGDDLDETAITAFVGSNNGFVSKWYDQSGNSKNLTQPNDSNQPRMIENGVIQKENGKPFIRFYGHNATHGTDGIVDYLQLPATMTTNGHVAVVNKFGVGGSSDGFILGNTGDYKWHSDNASLKLFNSGYVSQSIKTGKVWQNGLSINPTSAIYNTKLMVNTITPTPPALGTEWDNIGSDRLQFHDTNLGGGYAELIIFSAELNTTERPILEQNQITYYSTLVADNLLNKNGQIILQPANFVNKNGAIGVSAITKYGENITP